MLDFYLDSTKKNLKKFWSHPFLAPKVSPEYVYHVIRGFTTFVPRDGLQAPVEKKKKDVAEDKLYFLKSRFWTL